MSVHRCDRRSLSPTSTYAPSVPSPCAARPRAEQTELCRPKNGIVAVLGRARCQAAAHAVTCSMTWRARCRLSSSPHAYIRPPPLSHMQEHALPPLPWLPLPAIEATSVRSLSRSLPQPPNPWSSFRRPRRSFPAHLLSKTTAPLLGARAPAKPTALLRRPRPPGGSLPQSSPQIGRTWPLGPAPPLPRPSPASTSPEFRLLRRPHARGPHCRVCVLSRVFCANQGQICEGPNLSRGLLVNRFFTLLSVLAESCKIHIKSQKNQKNAKQILLPSLCVYLQLF
jgi:hypothetical protein